MSFSCQINHALNYSRATLYGDCYRSPIFFIGDDAYPRYLDTQDTTRDTLNLCAYVDCPEELMDLHLNLNGLGIHLESSLKPLNIEPLCQHLHDSGSEAVFSTDLKTRKTVVFFKEVKHAA